jgi:hypothetical protein
LKDDRHVGGIEQFDWVVLYVSSCLLVVDSDVHLESLEEVNYHKDEHSGEYIVKVRESFSEECLFKSSKLVWISPEEVEKSNESSFIFFSFLKETERFPKKFFTDVSSDEEGNSGHDSVPTLTQNLVQQVNKY